jgi:hypothetical protein
MKEILGMAVRRRFVLKKTLLADIRFSGERDDFLSIPWILRPRSLMVEWSVRSASERES